MHKNRPPLTRAQILQAALKLLDQQGLASLSMRKLAATLDVEAMSLYNYIKDKNDLLDGLANMVLAQVEPSESALSWDERLKTYAQNIYTTLIHHPDLVVILASEQAILKDPKAMLIMDGIIAALAESGLDPLRQVNAYRGLLAMCFGFVLAHTQGLSKTKEQAQEAWDRWVIPPWDGDQLSNLARLGPYFMQTHADDDFHFMLGGFIDYLHILSDQPGE